MATPCVLWCLVLVDLILLSSEAELVQTSPSYTPLCPGDRLVLTCTTTTGSTFWRIPGQRNEAEPVSGPKVVEGLMLNVTSINGITITTTGIYQSINVSLNGSEVACAGASIIAVYATVTITIA
uniref:Ig-like domain-containing protein n=1 Tax=Amphimedon queenslandica TaxID=400682 RepID=A0A1X7TGD5_AMPQE